MCKRSAAGKEPEINPGLTWNHFQKPYLIWINTCDMYNVIKQLCDLLVLSMIINNTITKKGV